MKESRGISPLLATLILIAITIAGGVVVYQIFFRAAGTLGETLEVQASADIVKTQPVTLLTITVRNVGTKQIENCTVTFYGNDNSEAVLELGAIGPGMSVSDDVTNPLNFTVDVGRSYPVKIWARASDGSTITRTLTVTVSA